MTKRVVTVLDKGWFTILANEAPCPIVVGGITYRTLYHAYYGYLAGSDLRRVAKIRNSASIVLAQENLGPDVLIAAQNGRSHDTAFGLDKTVEVLRQLLTLKLYGSLECRQALMATYGSDIVVVSGNDCVLGAGKSRLGLNLTGLLLMELRDYYVGRGGLRAPEFRDL